MSKSCRSLCAAIAVGLTCLVGVESARAADGLWATDFAAAQARARAEKKLLLVEFTGSDWCPPCKRLAAEVFSLEAFQKAASEKFVLVMLDYPVKLKLPDELKAQNDELKKRYQITAYPTVLLMDADGNRFGRTGYRSGGETAYLDHLQELLAANEAVVAAKAKLGGLAGLARAKLLDEIVSGYEKLRHEGEEVDKLAREIITLDADNGAGLKAKYEFRIASAEAAELLKARKTDEALAAYEKALKLPGISTEQKQRAHIDLGGCYFAKDDFIGVVDCLKQARAAAPESTLAQSIESMLERFAPKAEAQAKVAQLTAEAEKAQGVDRAKVLDQIVDATKVLGSASRNPKYAQTIAKLSKEIVELDPENKAGLKDKYEKKP